jgi:hypothetical protein
LKLTYLEKLFLAEYNKNGGNGTEAYLSLKPHVSRRSASVCATRILKKTAVTEVLQKHTDKQIDEGIASREKILEEIHEIRERALEQDKLQTSLNASSEKAKIAGHYKDKESDMTQFNQFLQQIFIVPPPDEDEKVIDVKPKEKKVK